MGQLAVNRLEQVKDIMQNSELTKYIPHAAGAALVLFGMFAGGGNNLKQSLTSGSELKQTRIEARDADVRSDIQQEILQGRADVAAQRLTDGCIPVFNTEDTTYYGNLVEGTPVTDRASKTPLADGLCVFNGYGTTAVMFQGVATDLATTGDRTLVDSAYKTWTNANAGSGAGIN